MEALRIADFNNCNQIYSLEQTARPLTLKMSRSKFKKKGEILKDSDVHFLQQVEVTSDE